MNIEKQIASIRFLNSGLTKKFKTPEICAEKLIGVQAQILSSAGLALFNRLENYDIKMFKDDLYKKREIIKLWGQRTTLHLYASYDWSKICSANLNEKSWWSKKVDRLFENKEEYNNLLHIIEEFAIKEGEFTRKSIQPLITDTENLLNSWGGIFIDMVNRGTICHSKQIGNERYFAHRQFWKQDLKWKYIKEVEAKRLLLKRFLINYSPATLQDFSYWSGLSLTETRQLFVDIEEEFIKFTFNKLEYFITKEIEQLLYQEIYNPEIILLSRFDPILLAYKDKTWLINKKDYKKVWREAGHIEGTIIKDFRIVGTWNYKLSAKDIKFSVFQFEKLSKKDKDKMDINLQKIKDFFERTDYQINMN